MNATIRQLGTAWVCAMLALGCGSDDSGGDAKGGAGGSSSDGGGKGGTGGGSGGSGGGSCPAPTVTYSGKITQLDPLKGTVPLGDVQICAESHACVPCITAGADGSYTWPGLPANSEV